jgi:hypothetical protein
MELERSGWWRAETVLAQRVARAVPTLEVAGIDDPRWMAFIEGHPDATVFHHPAWAQVLADAYGYRPSLIVHVDDGGDIVAGLPVMDVRGLLRSRRFISMPFTDYCPPLARDEADLTFFAEALGPWQIGAQSTLEVRGALPDVDAVRPVDLGFRHVLTLDHDPARIAARFHSNARWCVKRARREGLTIRIGTSAADLEPFYRLHWLTRRRLGVPLQPRRFFESLWRRVIESGLGFVAFVCLGERPVAADLLLAWNGMLVRKFNASDHAYWLLRPNNLAVLAGIEWGCQAGYRMLDFGKTETGNEGLRSFKLSWGARELPLIYSYVGGSPPNTADGPAFRLVSRMIERTPPVVCRLVGELLYRHFP